MKRLRKWLKRILKTSLALLVLSVIVFFVYFPGQQSQIAFTLATGLGVSSLQTRIDALEDKAILGKPFTDEDKTFLTDLYTCFAKGGKLTFIYGQSAQMMTRYLSQSGEDLLTDSKIFTGSEPVIKQMAHLKKSITSDLRNGVPLKTSYTSETFNMADPKYSDSITGLYLGKLSAYPQLSPDGTLIVRWRAEVPWVWPTYESLNRQYGNFHARSFPIPNARSILQGSIHCLYIDDGLGAHLENLGLAASFLVYSQWDESIDLTDQTRP